VGGRTGRFTAIARVIYHFKSAKSRSAVQPLVRRSPGSERRTVAAVSMYPAPLPAATSSTGFSGVGFWALVREPRTIDVPTEVCIEGPKLFSGVGIFTLNITNA
jgi:hypothetical protein